MGKGDADVKFPGGLERLFFSNERCDMPRCQAAEPPLLLLRGASLAEAVR